MSDSFMAKAEIVISALTSNGFDVDICRCGSSVQLEVYDSNGWFCRCVQITEDQTSLDELTERKKTIARIIKEIE